YPIMRKVIENKPKNDRRALDSYEYDCYNKVELDVDNISSRLKRLKIAKKVFGVLDSIMKINDEDGRTILPVFISETMSNYYYKENPTMRKEIIRAAKVTGIGVDDGSFISQLMGSSFQQYNFYKSWVSILQKDFVSPVADSWKLYYEYFLSDTAVYIGENPCWEIEITPKRPQDLAFTGRIWINKNDYALQRIDLTIGREANINFIEKIKMQQDFTKTDAGPYLASKTRFVVDLADLSDSTAGMIMKFYSSNKDFVVNKPRDAKFFDQSVEMLETANQQDEAYWNQNRHDPISESERKIFQMVDTLKHLPVLRNYIEVFNILVNGYKRVGKFDIGPYLFVYTYNTHRNDDSHHFYGEGHRFRLGFRTNYHFSKKIVFRAYAAYGTLDKAWKYDAEARWIISRKPWTTFGIESKYDLNQVGLIGFNGQNANLFRAFAMWGNLVRPFYQFENSVFFEGEIVKDLSQRVTFHTTRFDPLYRFGYYHPDRLAAKDSTIFNNLNYSEVILETRYARDETFLQNENERISLGTRSWQIFTFRYTLGLKNVFGSQFNYHKFNAIMSHDLMVGIFGRMTYIISAGYIPSNVPYPML
ncbi:MAG: carboxypeptidase-like regulatory domain-containing protein, partial [Cytophagales bacterium]|nr:carboxypeptidase-like regulatory domain-containing protein [Cytophagales bacterium]